MYLIKKNLLKTIVDLFIENPNKGNLLHSSILELFDYLANENIKKLGHSFLQNYSEILFKHPFYSKYFSHFVECYDGKHGGGPSSMPPSLVGLGKNFSSESNGGSGSSALHADPLRAKQLEQMRRQDEDFGRVTSSSSLLAKSLLPQKRFSSKDEEEEDDNEDDEDDDDRYNQEMFKKRKAELEASKTAQSSLIQQMYMRRKSSSGGESSSEEEEEED